MEEKLKYRVVYRNPHQHFVDIEFTVSELKQDKLQLQLPAWRPGRYELANFAKNVQKFTVYSDAGEPLSVRKLAKDLWEVDSGGQSSVRVEYNYYANELNAGSTYIDEKQLYINPVNCFVYVPDWINEPAILELDIPTDWEVASGMKPTGNHSFSLDNFHELADCPFIASGGLQHETYEVDDVKFHLWFEGEFKTDWERIKKDFKNFTKAQIDVMGGFPVPEYHFLFQIRTYKTYHGVEHSNSTVIALGPSYDILKPVLYDEFLGVSSHELFHTWNVKALRPTEMTPYDYSKENYTRLGYVTEGVTTYAGDLFLYQAGCFSELEFFKNINKLFQRHFHNYGRFNLSVADSSFDTWLDGYDKGIPHRKTSIYNEGALLAMMLDLSLLKDTGNKSGILTVTRLLYERFGNSESGYTEKDYQDTVEEVGGRSYAEFFKNYYYGTKDIEEELAELMSYVGLEIKNTRSRLYFENRFGFKIEYIQGRSAKITDIAPGSIADKAQLKLGDEIVSINGIRVIGNLKEWCKYFKEEIITLTINGEDDTRKVELTPTEERYYRTRWPKKSKETSEEQKNNYRVWTKRGY
jgi:predicted metalloprotease with PDZ domain